MRTPFPHQLGLTVSLFAGLVHLVWAILVAANVGEQWMSWVVRLHGMEPVMKVTAMSVGQAVGLIVLALVVGYIVGRVLGEIWERVIR